MSKRCLVGTINRLIGRPSAPGPHGLLTPIPVQKDLGLHTESVQRWRPLHGHLPTEKQEQRTGSAASASTSTVLDPADIVEVGPAMGSRRIRALGSSAANEEHLPCRTTEHLGESCR